DVALARPHTAEELLAALRSASEEADRLARMAEDLLVLSRAQQGRLPVLRAPTSLLALLTASARLFEARARAAPVRIGIAASAVTASIDQARTRQAVDNLLDNAIRFAPPGSAVTLQATVADCQVRIVVDDFGPGFPPAFRDRAFDAYQRAPASAAHPGTH